MTQLFDSPPIFGLPLSKGGDLYFGFIYKLLVTDVNGEPVLDSAGQRQYEITDYPAGSSVTLIIETDDPDTPITIVADIVGSLATVWEDKAVADTVPKGRLWRTVITFSDGFDQVMCNGTTIRSDGVLRK